MEPMELIKRQNDFVNKMHQFKVVPEILCTAPKEMAHVIFPSGAMVNFGSELTPTQVRDQPEVGWQAENENFYSICMIDPDSPSRFDPVYREWLHWLVVNIPGHNISDGEIIAEYIGAAPPEGSGLHRYVILVYKQIEHNNFANEVKLKNDSFVGRESFRIRTFAKKYVFGDPIAGNIFMACWDPYVAELQRRVMSI